MPDESSEPARTDFAAPTGMTGWIVIVTAGLLGALTYAVALTAALVMLAGSMAP